MSVLYDHQLGAVAVPHKKADYLKAIASGFHGLHQWGTHNDSIAERIVFRHEHAHFTSFQSSGLAELQSVVAGWKLTMLIACSMSIINNNAIKVVRVPLLTGSQSQYFTERQVAAFNAAWKQAEFIESYLFGLGTKLALGELFSFGIADRFVESFPAVAAFHNVHFFRRFLKQMSLTVRSDLLNDPAAANARRIMTGEKYPRIVSSRSVMEAYAVTIEVIAEYVKFMWTNENPPRQTPKRKPDQNYLIAIEHVLAQLDVCISIDEYIYGRAPAHIYWAVALVTHSAMQVPVLEDVQGDTIVMGSLNQISIAQRLVLITENIKEGKISDPRSTYNSDTPEILRWISECQRAIGDPWSMKFCQHIDEVVCAMPQRFLDVRTRDPHRLSWLARSLLYRNPQEMIGDGGIWLTDLQVKYVVTADGGVLAFGEDSREILMEYVRDSCLYILEAMIRGGSWAAVWHRLSPLRGRTRLEAIMMCLAYYTHNLEIIHKKGLFRVVRGYA